MKKRRAIEVVNLSEEGGAYGLIMVQNSRTQIISSLGTREKDEPVISIYPNIDDNPNEGIHLVIENPAELDRLIEALRTIKIG